MLATLRPSGQRILFSIYVSLSVAKVAINFETAKYFASNFFILVDLYQESVLQTPLLCPDFLHFTKKPLTFASCFS
jgi:hypothetical protein